MRTYHRKVIKNGWSKNKKKIGIRYANLIFSKIIKKLFMLINFKKRYIGKIKVIILTIKKIFYILLLILIISLFMLSNIYITASK